MQLPAVAQGRNIAIHNPTATDSIRKPKPQAIRASRYAIKVWCRSSESAGGVVAEATGWPAANDLDQVRCRSRQSTARGALLRAGGVQEN
jgi:hypothetical protein